MANRDPKPRMDLTCPHGPVRNSVVLAVLFFVICTVLLFRPIDDVDIFLQIKQGEILLDRLSFPSIDEFTYSWSEESPPAICWLSQLIFACFYRCGSWPLLNFFHVLLFSGSFLLMGRIAAGQHCEGGKDIGIFSVAFAVTFCFLVSLSNSSLRPQSIALFCFALILSIVHRKRPASQSAFLLAPVAVFWNNAHPSLSILVGCFIALFLAECIESRRGGGPAFRGKFLCLAILVAILQVIHPDGLKLLTSNAANVVISREWLHVTEWLPPWHSAVFVQMLPFWAVLCLSGVLALHLRNRVRPADLGLFALMTALSLFACRFALFWSIAMVPILACWIEQSKPADLFSWSGNAPVSKTTLRFVLAVGLVVTIFIPTKLHHTEVSPSIWPERGLQALYHALPQGRIYNTREWGGALVFFGYPSWKVNVDGRLYFFDRRAFWEDYRAAAMGKTTLEDINRLHQPDAFFLHPGFHQHLVGTLHESPYWKELYADALCVIYLPTDRLRSRQATRNP